MATNLGTAYVQVMPTTKGIGGNIANEFGSAGTSAGTLMGGKLVGALSAVFAGAAIGATVANFFKKAIEAGGELQQSFGGLDTIFGDASDSMKEMAYNASKAGISANDYAEQAVSMGAALKQAVGDEQEAADLADLAIMDMADNAAKMGTDISMIQNAYQGFAKGNYTMLDNLKLGFGGTKSEMERLLAYADEIDAKNGIIHGERTIENLDDIIGAIHTVQHELGLTGVAAQEGSETFEGSLNAMKASAQNLLANLSLGEDITPALEDLLANVGNFLFNNVFPMIGNVIKSLPALIEDGLNWVFENLPGAIDAVINWLNNLTQSIQDNQGLVLEKLKEIGGKMIEALKEVDWKGLGMAIIELIGVGLIEFDSTLRGIMESLSQSAMEKFQSVDWAGLGEKVINFIKDGLSNLGHLIWDKLKEIGESAWEKLKNINWAGVGTWILNEIAREFTNAGHLIWGGLKALGERAKQEFTELPWVQMGADVINGIVEGLTSFGNAIWEVLSNMASEAWNGLLDFFGINSPSKLMRDTVGKPIALGIAAGIDAEANAVQKSLDDIAKDAAGVEIPLDMAGDFNGGGSGLTDNSNITINVYAADGMNLRELADEVSRRLTFAERQKQAAWGAV